MAKDSSMKDESHGGHHAIRHITRQKKIIIINQEQELKRLRILVVTLSESSTVHVVSFLNWCAGHLDVAQLIFFT